MSTRSFYTVMWFSLCIFLGVASNASADRSSILIAKHKDWGIYDQGRGCWASSVPTKRTHSKNGKVVSVRRGDSFAFATGNSNEADVMFYYTAGYDVDPSKPIRMYVDGQLFHLKVGDLATSVIPKSQAQNRQIIIALKKGFQAEIITNSARGTKVNDRFSLLGFTAAAQAVASGCQTRRKTRETPPIQTQTSTQKRATGGGEVRVMEVVATNRKSRGKLDACEISYILAFEDYIYLDGGITFLRGALSLAGFTNDADREPAFLFKITAFDLLAEGHKLAPLEYAYLSTDNISYAGKESTIIDASDGGLVVAYDVSNSSLNFIEPLTLNIMRKDGRSDVAVPVNFMEADLNAGVSYAACMLSLLEVLTNKFN